MPSLPGSSLLARRDPSGTYTVDDRAIMPTSSNREPINGMVGDRELTVGGITNVGVYAYRR